MTIGKITSVAIPSPSQLSIVWDDGRRAQLDLAPLINARPALAPLRDPEAFGRVTLSSDGWSLEWPCGIDFGSAQLRRWADELRAAA